MLIGEHAWSRPGSHGDQARTGRHLAVVVQLGIAAPVQPDGGPHHPVHQLETDQLTLIRAAADDELVPPSDMADVLDFMLVLIGPEAIEVVIRGR